MPKPPALPIEVHDHFRKANILHTYVQKSLGEAKEHALETGQELLAAKAAVPHGRWEAECDRLFDGSARTARFYMSFAKDVGALPKSGIIAVLMLEGTLTGAAKLAKQAAKDIAAEDDPPAPEAPTDNTEPENIHEEEDAAFDPPPRTPKNRKAKPPKKLDRKAYYKQWDQAIGPLVRVLANIGRGLGELNGENYKRVDKHLHAATKEMDKWLGVKR